MDYALWGERKSLRGRRKRKLKDDNSNKKRGKPLFFLTFRQKFSIIYVESEGRKLEIECSYTFLISFEIQNDDCSYDELLSVCKEKGEEEGLPIERVNDIEFVEKI